LITRKTNPYRIKVIKHFCKESFIFDMDIFSDFALLILEVNIGSELGFIGTQIWTDLNKFTDAKIIGFQNDLKNSYLLEKNIFINFPFLLETKLDYFQKFLRYNVDSSPGQSGAPIYYYDKIINESVIIGMHLGKLKYDLSSSDDFKLKNLTKNQNQKMANTHKYLNLGLPFDENFFNQLKQWIEIYNISNNNLPLLKRLNLGWKNLKDEELKDLNQLKTIYLKELILNRNNLTDETINLLIELKFDNLNILELERNYLTLNNINDIGNQIIFINLLNLNLSGNQINDVGFVFILKHFNMEKLLSLDLSENLIIGEILKEFSEPFKFKNLEKLDLTDNKVNKEGKWLLEEKLIFEKGKIIFSQKIQLPKKN